MFDRDLVYHCSSLYANSVGGVETYVANLVEHGIAGVSDLVIKDLENIEQSQFKLLHIHTGDLLLQLTGECPYVFTVHNHSPYCPSGTKYLGSQKMICDRNISYFGCLRGKILDGCGSRKPQRILKEWQHSARALEILKKMRITIVATSDYIRQQLIQNGVEAEKVVTLRCGSPLPTVNTAPLSLETHQMQRILFAGRIVPDKGLEWLLNALVNTDRHIHLDIAGDGWDKPRLQRLAQKLGLNDRIVWHGFCDRDKLERLYSQCFAVIFPSVWPEPAGLVTLEANARKRTVIASAVGGIPEHIIDGSTGILVPANDIQQLATAIADLARDYEKCRKMGEQASNLFMNEFSISVHIKNLQKIYSKALE